jgi:hypothetical protein
MIAEPFELVEMVLPVITVAPVWATLPLMVIWPDFTVSVPVQSCPNIGSRTTLLISGAANDRRVKTIMTATARIMLSDALW